MIFDFHLIESRGLRIQPKTGILAMLHPHEILARSKELFINGLQFLRT
jgi:hypothetical protein